MHKVRYVILNGPPSSGKSTIARELTRELAVQDQSNGVIQDSFASPLKHFFATALGDKFNTMNKEKARPELNGYSLRQAWIDLAEQYMKKRFGEDCFGRWLVCRSLRNPTKLPFYVIVDDGGFPGEINAVPNRFVVKVIRPGTDFLGDSRGYFDNPQYNFMNNGTMIDLFQEVKRLSKVLRGEHANV